MTARGAAKPAFSGEKTASIAPVRSPTPAEPDDEIIFAGRRNHPETDGPFIEAAQKRRYRREDEFPMVDAVVALLGLFSASIFLAHAVDVYQAQPARKSLSAPGVRALG